MINPIAQWLVWHCKTCIQNQSQSTSHFSNVSVRPSQSKRCIEVCHMRHVPMAKASSQYVSYIDCSKHNRGPFDVKCPNHDGTIPIKQTALSNHSSKSFKIFVVSQIWVVRICWGLTPTITSGVCDVSRTVRPLGQGSTQSITDFTTGPFIYSGSKNNSAKPTRDESPWRSHRRES